MLCCVVLCFVLLQCPTTKRCSRMFLLILMSKPTLQQRVAVVGPWIWMGLKLVMVGAWLVEVLELVILLLGCSSAAAAIGSSATASSADASSTITPLAKSSAGSAAAASVAPALGPSPGSSTGFAWRSSRWYSPRHSSASSLPLLCFLVWFLLCHVLELLVTA